MHPINYVIIITFHSEQVILSLEITPFPIGQLVKLLSGHPENHVEIRIRQMFLQVDPIDVTRQPVIGSEEQM